MVGLCGGGFVCFVVMVLVWAIEILCRGCGCDWGWCDGGLKAMVAVGQGSLLVVFQFLGPFGGG